MFTGKRTSEYEQLTDNFVSKRIRHRYPVLSFQKNGAEKHLYDVIARQISG